MEESTITMDDGAIARGQCKSALETILREGGRRLLQEALELEVQQYIERFQQLKNEAGQSLVVRNGYQQERELVTGAGKVPVRLLRCTPSDVAGCRQAVIACDGSVGRSVPSAPYVWNIGMG